MIYDHETILDYERDEQRAWADERDPIEPVIDPAYDLDNEYPYAGSPDLADFAPTGTDTSRGLPAGYFPKRQQFYQGLDYRSWCAARTAEALPF